MFTLKLTDTYKWPVKFSVPVDGKHQTAQFTAVFKRLSQTELENLTKTEGITDLRMAVDVTAGVEDIQDESGNAVGLNTLLDIPGAATALVVAYMDSVTGAPRKN